MHLMDRADTPRLRCDRQTPCGACVRRGKAVECVYSVSEQERKQAIDYRPHTRRQEVRQRVARLESLVIEMRDMAQNSSQPPITTAPSIGEAPKDPALAVPSPSASVAGSMGKLSPADKHAFYTGSSHWVTILEDVSFPVLPFVVKIRLIGKLLDPTPQK